jgi:fatty-acyl-CoA synthase
MIRRAARAFPAAPAISDRRSLVTLSDVADRAERFANALDRLGTPARACIGVLSENRLEYPEVDLGIAVSGRVRVALNSRLHHDDFRFALADCGAQVLVHSGAFAEDAAALATELGLTAISLDEPQFGELSYQRLIAEAPAGSVARAIDKEQPAWISYTSGTTGRPKGVVLSHRAIRQVALNLLLELGPSEPGERMVLAQPLSHGAGYFVLPQLIAGGGVHVMKQFDVEEVIWASTQPGVTTFKAVPAMFPPLLDAIDASPRNVGFDTVIYGAAPMPGPVLERAIDRLGNVMVQVYGQSEAPITLSCLHKADHAQRGGQRSSAGRPWRSVEVEIRDPAGNTVPLGETGEVTIRGQHHMTGYLNLEDATSEVLRDGWVWTKDLGRIDDQGYLYLLGRRDEIINSGGFNISPREVEQAIQLHPDVEECAVIGLPHERWGAAVHAMVRLRPSASITSAELHDFAKLRLTFRAPHRFVVADQIPRNPYGKVDRERVKTAFLADGVSPPEATH